MGSHVLLCGFFPTQGSNPRLLHLSIGRQVITISTSWEAPFCFFTFLEAPKHSGLCREEGERVTGKPSGVSNSVLGVIALICPAYLFPSPWGPPYPLLRCSSGCPSTCFLAVKYTASVHISYSISRTAEYFTSNQFMQMAHKSCLLWPFGH